MTVTCADGIGVPDAAATTVPEMTPDCADAAAGSISDSARTSQTCEREVIAAANRATGERLTG
jgi:hypothetical protein